MLSIPLFTAVHSTIYYRLCKFDLLLRFFTFALPKRTMDTSEHSGVRIMKRTGVPSAILLILLTQVSYASVVRLTPPAGLAGYALGRAEEIANICEDIQLNNPRAEELRAIWTQKSWDAADFDKGVSDGRRDTKIFAAGDEAKVYLCDPSNPIVGALTYGHKAKLFQNLLSYRSKKIEARLKWPKEQLEIIKPRTTDAFRQGWLLGKAVTYMRECEGFVLDWAHFDEVQDFWAKIDKKNFSIGAAVGENAVHDSISMRKEHECDPKRALLEYTDGSLNFQVTGLIKKSN
jgi:hypothetical protein